MSTTKRLVVCGGNGFLGSRICKHAVQRGWDVTSISRSGTPKWDAITSSSAPPAWSHKVTWERANILQPATYASLLRSTDFVVHSLGILLEADYKGVLRGQESPISGLRKAFTSAPQPGNPLERGVRESDNDIRPPETREQLTYETMNRDSAIMLAKKAAEENVSAFVYISAVAGAPVLPSRYISTKREAERAIASEFPRMRSIFMRAPFLYDSSRPITMPLAALTGVSAAFNGLTGGIFGNLMGSAGTKPLQADVVAAAVVQSLANDDVKGPVEPAEMEELAHKEWRSGML